MVYTSPPRHPQAPPVLPPSDFPGQKHCNAAITVAVGVNPGGYNTTIPPCSYNLDEAVPGRTSAIELNPGPGDPRLDDPLNPDGYYGGKLPWPGSPEAKKHYERERRREQEKKDREEAKRQAESGVVTKPPFITFTREAYEKSFETKGTAKIFTQPKKDVSRSGFDVDERQPYMDLQEQRRVALWAEVHDGFQDMVDGFVA